MPFLMVWKARNIIAFENKVFSIQKLKEPFCVSSLVGEY